MLRGAAWEMRWSCLAGRHGHGTAIDTLPVAAYPLVQTSVLEAPRFDFVAYYEIRDLETRCPIMVSQLQSATPGFMQTFLIADNEIAKRALIGETRGRPRGNQGQTKGKPGTGQGEARDGPRK